MFKGKIQYPSAPCTAYVPIILVISGVNGSKYSIHGASGIGYYSTPPKLQTGPSMQLLDANLRRELVASLLLVANPRSAPSVANLAP